MNKKMIGVVAVLTFLIGCGCQQSEDTVDDNESQQPSANVVVYDCEGETIKADFNNDVDPRTATIYVTGTELILLNVEAGSGAKYSDGDVTFWTHQGEATLSMEDTGASLNCVELAGAIEDSDVIVDENGNVVASECRVWFDGCNNCHVSPDGMLACTRMFCDPATMQIAKCMDEASINKEKQDCNNSGRIWSEEQDNCFENPATMAGEGKK